MGHHEEPGEREEWLSAQVAKHLTRERLSILAHNLAIGGALCQAFDQGWRWPYYIDHEAPDEEIEWSDWARSAWRPGCGRPSDALKAAAGSR